jgi:hypothetical protein
VGCIVLFLNDELKRSLGKAGEKGLGTGLLWIFEHLLGAAHFVDHAIFDKDNAVGEVIGESQFMGD